MLIYLIFLCLSNYIKFAYSLEYRYSVFIFKSTHMLSKWKSFVYRSVELHIINIIRFCLPADIILWTYWYFILFVENKSTKTQPIHKTHFTPHHGGSFETKVGGKWNNVSSQRMSWVGSKCDVMCNMMQDKIINKAFHYIYFPPK